jgi:hypothetical protein
VAVSARSNRALSKFWGIVLAALACLLIGLELAAAPPRKGPAPAERRAGNAVVTHQSAEQTSHSLTSSG